MNNYFTRGNGFLEAFLAKKRAKKADSLIRNTDRNSKILDLGYGKFPYFLVHTYFREKHGIDHTEPFLLEGIHLKKFNKGGSRLPYQSQIFSTVTMLAVIEHIECDKVPFLLREIYRILKLGGRLILTTPTPIGNNILHFMKRVNLVSKEEIDEHKKSYSLNELKNILVSNKFHIVQAGRFEFFMNNYVCAEKGK